MTRSLVQDTITCLNMFPYKNGISSDLSPAAIILGWGVGRLPPAPIDEAVHNPRCNTPTRMQLFRPYRIQIGHPPTAWRCCTSTALPPGLWYVQKVPKTIDSKDKSSQNPFSWTYSVYTRFLRRFPEWTRFPMYISSPMWLEKRALLSNKTWFLCKT